MSIKRQSERDAIDSILRKDPNELKLKAEASCLQLDGTRTHVGDEIGSLRRVLNLREGRATRLTNRINSFFCALAAARLYRPDGWFGFGELAELDSWSGAESLSKFLANEFEAARSRDDGIGIFEQEGRGSTIRFRLRMPASHVEVGELPERVRKIFVRQQQTAARMEDRQPRPVVDRELATAVARALETSEPDRTLVVTPLYQGGHGSLVFAGLSVRRLDDTKGRPVANSVLVKVAISLGTAATVEFPDQALDDEHALLRELAGAPGLPTDITLPVVDLQPIAELLNRRSAAPVRPEALRTRAMIASLGQPRTVEAELHLLSSVIDAAATPLYRLTRRNIHNVLILAERLASLTRLLHVRRRAHRHLSVDAIVLCNALGIFDHILAADLAGSVTVQSGSDDLLYQDLFDLGRVLVHVITGRPPSTNRRDFQPPGFPGRAQLNTALGGKGETVSRLLFLIGHYLLEASPSGDPADAPTVRLLDHFLEEIAHLNTVHWAKARGVPERQVPFGTPNGALNPSFAPREVWVRATADPVATRLVTISHLVDVQTLQRWCVRYISSVSGLGERTAVGFHADRSRPATPDACMSLLRQGLGRAAAQEMWGCLRDSLAARDEEVDRQLIRLLRNYAIHWLREERFDIAHELGSSPSTGLFDELDQLKERAKPRSEDNLLVRWIDEVRRHVDRNSELGKAGPAREKEDRLRSWMHALSLLRLVRDKHKVPTEDDIHAFELVLRGNSTPESVFWHIMLARAWVSTMSARQAPSDAMDGESGWDKAMRMLVMAAGAAAARKLPYEVAATLATSAYLTREALATPELREAFAKQAADEDNVRIQAAECALMAADAYQWLDNQERHYLSLLEAVRLLQGCIYAERLIYTFQLLALARNNRLLAWEPSEVQEPALALSTEPRFVRYGARRGDPEASARRASDEKRLFDDTLRAWQRAPRLRTSEDPATAVEHAYLSRYAPAYFHLFKADELLVKLDKGEAIDRLFELARARYGELAGRDGEPLRILNFGCGPGDEARMLAARGFQVRAVDSPIWFAAAKRDAAIDGGAVVSRNPEFIPCDPVKYAERYLAEGETKPEAAEGFDVVLFRCSLCRVSQRDKLLKAAWKLLRPGGLVLATDWVQTGTTDRMTWSRIVDTMRFVDLESKPGYRRLCRAAGFTGIKMWPWEKVIAGTSEPAGEPPMHYFFQKRLDNVRKRLESETAEQPYSPYDRAFLLRAVRDLGVLTAASTPAGPLGWLFWGARKPLQP